MADNTDRHTLGNGPWSVIGCAATVSRWAHPADALVVARLHDRLGCGHLECTRQHDVQKQEGDP